jgi:hypothetical protein
MMKRYRLVLEGHMLPDSEPRQVVTRTAALLNLDPQQVGELLRGKPRVIKRDLDEATAHRYMEAISQAGIACRMEDLDDVDSPLTHLSLEKTAEKSAPCPKCGFRPQSGWIGDMAEECPSCGIVIAKYAAGNASVPREAPRTAPGAGDTPVPSRLEPATLLKRRWAAAGSVAITCAALALFMMASAVCIYISDYDFFSQPLPHTPWALAKLARLNLFHAIAFGSATLLVVGFFSIFAPLRKSATWAQNFMNIQVVSTVPGKTPGLSTWILRAAGNTICILSIGLLCLLPCFREDRRSLADLLSGTRQTARGATVDGSVMGMRLVVIAIYIASSLGMAFSNGLLTHPQPVDRAAIEAQRNRNILETACQLEEKHLQDFGSYSEDPFDLLQKYINLRSPKNISIVKTITNGMLFLEKTESGFRAAVPVADPQGALWVYTQDGDQGIEENGYANYRKRMAMKLRVSGRQN